MEKENTVFYKSVLSACALFVLGNGVMVLPDKTADEYTFLGLIIASLTGIAVTAVLIPLADICCNSAENIFAKILKGVIFSSVSVAALFTAADTFSDFTRFVSIHILPEIGQWIITAVLVFTVVFFALKRQEDTLKFALICFLFVTVAVAFFFLATVGDFELQNIHIESLPDFGKLTKAAKPYFLKAVLPAFLLPFYRSFLFGSKRSTACFFGVAAGFVLLGVCVLSSVLLFSPRLAGRLSYPYASAISTVTIGKIFTRLDGFSYFIYFAAAIAKINICVFLAIEGLKKIKANFSRKTT